MLAAAVVSVSMGVMKPVLAKLATLMGDEYKKIKGLRKAMAFLQCELGDMDALLEKMDSADELDPQAKKWRRDIIEMSYNIEDHIDDFMHTVGEANGKIGILEKAAKYLRTFKDRRRLANDFQEIMTQVVEASERRKRYMLDQCISVAASVVVDPHVSALYKESASLVGIQSQKDELVSWSMDEVKQLKFMAIGGFGGIGKTTLANEVYHEVGGKFEYKAFVSVSQKPQMIVLFNSLLWQLGLQTYSNACQLQDPINNIREHLQNKRYFIVVDDLWDMQAWNAIQCAFPQSDHSSRIIITTRNKNVAAISCCHSDAQIHNMKHLSEQDSRKLFFDRIFGSEDACPTNLMKPSCEILNKCDGLPLAIITMASMLAHQPRELEAWEYILKSLGTKSAPDSAYEDMIYILDLSYKNLRRYLKASFLYLSSYPEDYEINRDKLVRRWVAEGFVSNSDGRHDLWDVAESYFNDLVNRSMIQPTYMKIKYFPDELSSYRVHDMLLELIVMRCKEDNFLSLVNDVQAPVEAQDRIIRRLTVACPRDAGDGEVNTSIFVRTNMSQVRSLTILLGESNWIPPMKFKYIRVFHLEISYSPDAMTIDLTCINQLSMLRYLVVSANVAMPGQIRGLPCLETLHLSRVPFGCTIPTEIVDVPRLSHLVMPSRSMWYMTGKMKSLHTLHGFPAPPDLSESIVDLGELAALSDLKFYFLRRWAVPEKKTKCMAALSNSLDKLYNLKRLCVLTMTYRLGQSWITWCTDELSSLSPPFLKLEELSMAGCRFSRVPKWIGHLQKLHFLHLGVKQILKEDVAVIGRGSSSLIRLRLHLTSIPTERIVIGGSTGFPHLRWFEFNCDGISHLTFEEGAMPELRDLRLVFDANKWDKH